MKKLVTLFLLLNCANFSFSWDFIHINPIAENSNIHPIIKEFVKDGTVMVGMIQGTLTLISLGAATYHGIRALVDKEQRDACSQEFVQDVSHFYNSAKNTIFCFLLYKALTDKK